MPTRRRFIKQASFATTALLMTRNSSWLEKEQLIGLQLYSVRTEIHKNVQTTIAKVAEAGYNSVEVFGYANGKFFGLSPKEFLAMIKQQNLRTPSGHYDMMNFLLNGDDDQLKKTVADAAEMGHEFFVVPYLTDNLRTS